MELLNNKILGGQLTHTEWNQVPSELQNIITSAGISLSSGDVNQLGKAITMMISSGQYYTEGGTANSRILTHAGPGPAPYQYRDNMIVMFVSSLNNTNTWQVNVNTLGAKDVVVGAYDSNSADVLAGDLVMLRYDAGAGNFLLVNQSNPVASPFFRQRVRGASTGLAWTVIQAVIDSGTKLFTTVGDANGILRLESGAGEDIQLKHLGGVAAYRNLFSVLPHATAIINGTTAAIIGGALNVGTVVRASAGVYDVPLPTAVSSVAATSVDVTPRDNTTTGFMAVALPTTTSNVRVRTFDASGTPADVDFSISVFDRGI